jgi:hypothetical protein
MNAFKPTKNDHKHFIIRLVDKGIPELEALQVTDAFNNLHKIYVKDKKAVRDLINQLMVHEQDLSDED